MRGKCVASTRARLLALHLHTTLAIAFSISRSARRPHRPAKTLHSPRRSPSTRPPICTRPDTYRASPRNAMDAQVEAADQGAAPARASRRRGRAITGGRQASSPAPARRRAAGRGHKRAREPTPPLPAADEGDEGSGEQDGDAGGEDEEEYDEEAAIKAALEASMAEQQRLEQAVQAAAAAAAAAQQQRQQQQPAAPLNPQQLRAAALASLMASSGATKEQ